MARDGLGLRCRRAVGSATFDAFSERGRGVQRMRLRIRAGGCFWEDPGMGGQTRVERYGYTTIELVDISNRNPMPVFPAFPERECGRLVQRMRFRP